MRVCITSSHLSTPISIYHSSLIQSGPPSQSEVSWTQLPGQSPCCWQPHHTEKQTEKRKENHKKERQNMNLMPMNKRTSRITDNGKKCPLGHGNLFADPCLNSKSLTLVPLPSSLLSPATPVFVIPLGTFDPTSKKYPVQRARRSS